MYVQPTSAWYSVDVGDIVSSYFWFLTVLAANFSYESWTIYFGIESSAANGPFDHGLWIVESALPSAKLKGVLTTPDFANCGMATNGAVA